MSIGTTAVIYEVIDNVEASGNTDNLYKLLGAVKMYEDGLALFKSGDSTGAIAKHNSALRELKTISEVVRFRAIVQSAMISEYASINQLEQAIISGQEAMRHLENDHRLAMVHARCLHDLGVALVQSRQLIEGIGYMEQALRVLETLPDGVDLAGIFMDNIERARAALSKPSSKLSRGSGWWSRLWGR